MELLRKLQLTQLHILKDITQICKENNLQYFLGGGTLLGAIRHGGFIPWDDDVDIVMYRKDLRKLEAILIEKYSEKYFVQNFRTDKRYTRYITKVRLNGTLQVSKGLENVQMHKGIYLDIFPLDFVNKKDGIGLEIRGKIIRLLFAYKTIRYSLDKNTTPRKKRLIKILSPFSRLIPDRIVNMTFDYICTMSERKNCMYTTNFASGYGWKKQLVDNSVYGEGTYKKFEDTEFLVPDKYDVILSQLYNNYMELPPLEKRKSGHVIVNIDIGEYKAKI